MKFLLINIIKQNFDFFSSKMDPFDDQLTHLLIFYCNILVEDGAERKQLSKRSMSRTLNNFMHIHNKLQWTVALTKGQEA